MLTTAYVSTLKLDDQVYSLLERTPEGAPAPFRVVGFDLHYQLPGGVAVPFLKGPDGEVFALTRYALREFAASPSEALQASSRQARLAGEAKGAPKMLYNVKIWDGKGRPLASGESLTEEQAQTMYQEALRRDLEATMTLVPVYRADGVK